MTTGIFATVNFIKFGVTKLQVVRFQSLMWDLSPKLSKSQIFNNFPALEIYLKIVEQVVQIQKIYIHTSDFDSF